MASGEWREERGDRREKRGERREERRQQQPLIRQCNDVVIIGIAARYVCLLL